MTTRCECQADKHWHTVDAPWQTRSVTVSPPWTNAFDSPTNINVVISVTTDAWKGRQYYSKHIGDRRDWPCLCCNCQLALADCLQPPGRGSHSTSTSTTKWRLPNPGFLVPGIPCDADSCPTCQQFPAFFNATSQRSLPFYQEATTTSFLAHASCTLHPSMDFNPSKTERNLFYIRTRSVPRSKHSPLRL
jgi:hypothetical protein